MNLPYSNLLRDRLSLKVHHVKRAFRSYVCERLGQATGQLSSYAVAAGLFAAAAVFVIGAMFVGLAALFRWVEITFGQFQAYTTVGGLLMLLAATCAGVAILRLNRKTAPLPSLPSRLRVAIASPPIPEGTVQRAAKETALAAGHRVSQKMDARTAGLLLGALALGSFTIARRKFSSPGARSQNR
jgi:hypothetical protein